MQDQAGLQSGMKPVPQKDLQHDLPFSDPMAANKLKKVEQVSQPTISSSEEQSNGQQNHLVSLEKSNQELLSMKKSNQELHVQVNHIILRLALNVPDHDTIQRQRS
jgi:hypothetical protein